MMQPNYQLVPHDYNEAWFDMVFTALDRLHDSVCSGTLNPQRRNAVSPMLPAEMIGWLEDIVYTAQETILEIRADRPDTHVTEKAEYSAKS